MQDLNSFLRGLETKKFTSDNDGQKIVSHFIGDYKLNDINSIFRKHATVLRTSYSQINIPLDNEVEYGGGWVLENNDYKSQDAKGNWKGTTINTYEMYTRVQVTRDFLDDMSSNITDVIENRVSSNFLKKENTAFLYGNGKIQPNGMLTGIEPIKINDSNPSIILSNLFTRLSSEYHLNAIFLINFKFASTLFTIADQKNIIIQNDKLTIFGCTAYIIPELNDSDLCVFVNMKNYYIVDNGDMKIIKDEYTYKPDVEFFFTKRVGGKLLNNNSICFFKENN
jgi:HK97 family phage major capsid protein